MLVDKMCEVGLLRCSTVPQSDGSATIVYEPFFPEGHDAHDITYQQQAAAKIVALRKIYQDRGRFTEYPEAAEAFSDLHRFVIPFRLEWTNDKGLKWYRQRRGKLWIAQFFRTIAIIGFMLGLFGAWPRLKNIFYQPAASEKAKPAIPAAVITTPQGIKK